MMSQVTSKNNDITGLAMSLPVNFLPVFHASEKQTCANDVSASKQVAHQYLELCSDFLISFPVDSDMVFPCLDSRKQYDLPLLIAGKDTCVSFPALCFWKTTATANSVII